MELKGKLTEVVFHHYIYSGDFNGLSFTSIENKFNLDKEELQEILIELVNNETLAIVYSGTNPHIRAFPDLEIQEQIKYLLEKTNLICVYPAKKFLSENIDRNSYKNQPYNLELALGAGHLEYRSFDLSVLESYRNDPRYYYMNDDISGSLCVKDEYFESDVMAEHDQILLKTFGFSYDDNYNRAVAVFIRYLQDLSPEHQQIWRSKELKKRNGLHPDYFRTCILGEFRTKMSLCDAFIRELEIINEMCEVMGKPVLFNKTFAGNKPNNFNFLVRPTLAELNSFIQILDKMMSENLNKKFFKGDISFEKEEERKDGKIAVSQKGTVTLLEEWCLRFFSPKDPQPLEDMISIFKKVRKLRQKPAHSVNEDIFNQEYFHEQRELLSDAYDGIRTIRLMLANHQKVKAANIDIPDILFKGDIWSY